MNSERPPTAARRGDVSDADDVRQAQESERMETHEQKLARVLRDAIFLVDYDPGWPRRFEEEAAHLRACLPSALVARIEHFGSTAVPGLAAKPVVDLLVEVRSAREAWERCAPLLEAQGYDAFWRPTSGSSPPFYPWFIKRDGEGQRSHHVHMVEPGFEHWDGLVFRDCLRSHPELAREYAELKRGLAERFPDDREAYTAAKGAFIRRITARAMAAGGLRCGGLSLEATAAERGSIRKKESER